MTAHIDKPVRSLVAALNRLPGVETFSSCGGHKGLLELSQVPAGRWFVHFSVDESGGAWRSLEKAARAVQQACWSAPGSDRAELDNTGEDDAVVLQAFVDDTGGLAFELRGRGVTADVVADAVLDGEE